MNKYYYVIPIGIFIGIVLSLFNFNPYSLMFIGIFVGMLILNGTLDIIIYLNNEIKENKENPLEDFGKDAFGNSPKYIGKLEVEDWK